MASADLFQAIFSGCGLEELDREFPFYPLTAPGMPLPGDDFVAAATQLGDPPIVIEGKGENKRLLTHGPALHYLYRRALYDADFSLSLPVRGQRRTADFVPGHLLGCDTFNFAGGPRIADVFVLGKNPGNDEVRLRRNFVGPTSQVFFDALNELGVSDAERDLWYCSNLVRWPQLDPQSDGIPIAHRKDCAIFLEQELRLVRPRYLLCLGSDASKAVLGTEYGVKSLVGRALDKTVLLSAPGQFAAPHRIRVMGLTHPAQVWRHPELYDEFKNQLALFLSLTNGADIGKREKGLRHVNVYTARALSHIVEEIRNDPNPLRRIIAVDGEWEGAYPTEPGAYLRTVQFSSAHGEGVTVVLRHQGGEDAFKPSVGHAIALLNRLLRTDEAAGWRPRVGGHFLRADLPWLIHAGIDVRQEYAPAAKVEDMRTQGGFETGLQYHAVNEAASYRLTDVMTRLTTAPVYDGPLKTAITDYCKQHDIGKDDLEGFGFLPDWILHPNHVYEDQIDHNYAGYDPDVTRRIAMKCLEPGGLLDKDWYNQPSWEPYFIGHRASLGVLQMEMEGIELDKDRMDKLALLYMNAYEALLAHFRQEINWPTFNPKSHPQCRAVLFGDRYAYRVDRTSGMTLPVRPPTAVSLNLVPLTTTGKRPKLWADVVARGEESEWTPSTNKEVLGIVGHQHRLAMHLRDLRFIAQTISGALRRPTLAENEEDFLVDSTDNMVYEDGIAPWMHVDGKIRTHVSQDKETGRWATARPPLQNLASRREADYARILGTFDAKGEARGAYLDIFPAPMYCHPIRSIFRADAGYILVEADLAMAEVAMLAWLSGDAKMIEYVRRGALDKDHPDYYEIHSQTAVQVFRLDCEPTKKGLEKAGFGSLRTAAKCVVAGSMLHTSNGLVPIEALTQHLADGEWQEVRGAATVANDGAPTPLVGLYNGGVKPCVRVSTQFGYSLTNTREHQYRVIDASGEYGWREAGELEVGDWVCVRNAVGPFGNDTSVPLLACEARTSFKPIDFPSNFTEDWAAFCALYVAEGCCDLSDGLGISISESHDPILRFAAEALLKRLFGDRICVLPKDDEGVVRFVMGSKHLCEWLRHFFGRVSHEKKIPAFVFKWPRELLSTFLSWLFDGDGTGKRNHTSFCIGYSTKSEELAKSVQLLCSMFGVVMRRTPESRKGRADTYWALEVRGNASKDRFLADIGFVSPRKAAKCRRTGRYTQDRDIIPYQAEHLRRLLPAVPGAVKEKCRECTRVNTRVALSPTRLQMILAACDVGQLDADGRRSYDHLLRISRLPCSFQQVATVIDAGSQQVYDVTTTNEHVVSYNGLLTHQSVRFGIPYGRQADAISRQCREEGVQVSNDECQRILDFWTVDHPAAGAFLAECRARSQNPRWISTLYGRKRRFLRSSDRSVIGEQERQAQNFPIQGGVADSVQTAVANFYQYQQLHPDLGFRMLLQNHDALLFKVPIPEVTHFLKTVLPLCMIDQVPIWPRYLDGRPMPVSAPYYFSIETKLNVNWGESITAGDAKRLGLRLDISDAEARRFGISEELLAAA